MSTALTCALLGNEATASCGVGYSRRHEYTFSYQEHNTSSITVGFTAGLFTPLGVPGNVCLWYTSILGVNSFDASVNAWSSKEEVLSCLAMKMIDGISRWLGVVTRFPWAHYSHSAAAASYDAAWCCCYCECTEDGAARPDAGRAIKSGSARISSRLPVAEEESGIKKERGEEWRAKRRRRKG